MSTLETNSIGKYSGNNVSIDDALNLKSYTTAQRDALTASAGDIIYNSQTGTIDYYNGSSWSDFPEGSYDVQPSSYEFLSYSITADYLTNNLRIRIKLDATRSNKRLFVDDTAIIFY